MTTHNTDQSYGSVAKFLHWLMSIAIITLLMVGAFMVGMQDGDVKFRIFELHKSTGLVILSLMIFRTYWTLTNTKPILPLNTKPWEKFAERSVHFTFYVLLFAMPLSGWILSVSADYTPTFYTLFKIPFFGMSPDEPRHLFAADVHFYLAWILTGLLSLHVAAGLKHHFIDKDNILTRMMPNRD